MLKTCLYQPLILYCLAQLAQNRCQETMELLEFRRRVLTDYVKEDEAKRQEEQHQSQQRHHKDEVTIFLSYRKIITPN